MKTMRSLLNAEIRRLRMRRFLAAVSVRLWAFSARHGVPLISIGWLIARILAVGGRRPGRSQSAHSSGPLLNPSVTASGQMLLPGIVDSPRWAFDSGCSDGGGARQAAGFTGG